MTNEERGGGNDRPTWPNKEAEDAAKIQVLLLWGFIMDLRVFPGRSDNQKFYVLGYSVMNKNDALVSKDGEFFPVPFADAYLFVNPERAQNYIDQNDLKKDNFTVVKTFQYLKAIGYASLEHTDDFIQKEMDKEKDMFLNTINFHFDGLDDEF